MECALKESLDIKAALLSSGYEKYNERDEQFGASFVFALVSKGCRTFVWLRNLLSLRKDKINIDVTIAATNANEQINGRAPTPFDIAMDKQNEAFLSLLLQHGAANRTNTFLNEKVFNNCSPFLASVLLKHLSKKMSRIQSI